MNTTRRTLSAVRYCDTRHEHEVRIITDGTLGLAYGLNGFSADAGPIYAVTTRPGYDEYQVTCSQPIDGDEDSDPCWGTVYLHPRPTEWVYGDAEAQDALDEWGSEVER